MRKFLLAALLGAFGAGQVSAQPGGPPRRLQNPETLQLPGGSRVEFQSFPAPSIRRSADFSIFIPAGYPDSGPLPVVYFLHGLFNDHTSWAVERYGDLPRRIEELMTRGEIPKCLIVHPDGENSFYTDSLDGSLRFEALIASDLPAEIERRYSVRGGRENRSIGGVSMGAFGALKIAMKQPEDYASAAGVSPIVPLGPDPSSGLRGSSSRTAAFLTRVFEPVFGIPFDREHWKRNSLEELARRADLKGLRIYFAYGTADRYNESFPMEAGVRELDRILVQRKAGHIYEEYEGEPHGWELVTAHLGEVMRFLTATF